MLTPTSKGDNFWPMKIEQSLPLPLMTPDKHQLTQCTTSLVPRKHHAQHFSLFFSLSLLHADNAGYRSTHAAPIVTIHLVWPRLMFSPTLIIPPIKIKELKLPPAKTTSKVLVNPSRQQTMTSCELTSLLPSHGDLCSLPA